MTGPTPPQAFLDDAVWMQARYVDEGMSGIAIARLVGVTPDTVYQRLRDHGIKVRPSRNRPADDPRLDDSDWLRARHHDDGWSLERIAGETGVTSKTVAARLVAHGIPCRTGRDWDRASREWLERRYLVDRDGIKVIADELGTTPGRVWKALVDYGIPRRPRGGLLADDPTTTINDPGWLRSRHHDDRWAVHRIAGHLGVSPDTVSRRLDDFGIQRLTNRQLRLLAAQDHLDDPDWLVDHHHHQGRTIHQIANRLGVPATQVAHAMGRHDITIRTTAKEALADRDYLEDLYVAQRLSQTQIGDILGVSASTVSRALRRHGIDTRPSRSPAAQGRRRTRRTGERRSQRRGPNAQPSPLPADTAALLRDPERLAALHTATDSQKALARRLGVNPNTLNLWLCHHGIISPPPARPGQDPRLRDRDWIAARLHAGDTSRDIADTLGCSTNTVDEWRIRHALNAEALAAEGSP